MRKILTWISSWLLMAGISTACVEPYDPPVDNTNVNYLVIDGFLNASEGYATVTVSRSLPVKSPDPLPRETGATVGIEDNHGTYYPLIENAAGFYVGPVANASTENTYRLLIRTNGSRDYASDFINIVQTPPIDSVTWSVKTDGLEIAVNTHDVTGNSRHYRWKYVETYEYNSNFNSIYMFTGNGTEVVYRPNNQSIYWCWKTVESTDILVGSTKHLKESVVSKHPIMFIPQASIKISVRYSILVQQQALSEEAYDYWLNLEKSTEHLGGLFDPLPSQVNGNITSLNNPGETVIGFFSGGTLTESRMFIERRKLPDYIVGSFTKSPYCELDSVYMNELETIHQPTRLLVDAIYAPGAPGPVGYTTTIVPCADCRSLGGTTVRPLFWD
jgi:hypothetical protein